MFALAVLPGSAVVAHSVSIGGKADGNLLMMALGAIAGGIFLFYRGWGYFHRKKCIEDIPTSKIRSVAMGVVEVNGKTLPKHELKTPYSQTDCVIYKYLKEKYVCHHTSRGRQCSWKKIDDGTSVMPFYVNDDTGRVLVEPLNIEIHADRRYHTKTGHGEGALRFSEWFIMPRETVYVMGRAGKSDDARSGKKMKLLARLEELKKNKEAMAHCDTNKDGTVDSMEWEIAMQQITGELEREELQKPVDGLADVSISCGNENEPFIISDKSEKELVGSLRIKSVFAISGGTLLFLAGTFYIILKFGN